MSADENPTAQAIFSAAEIEAALADFHGVSLRTINDLIGLAYLELGCLLAELENPMRSYIGERRDYVVWLITELMRVREVS